MATARPGQPIAVIALLPEPPSDDDWCPAQSQDAEEEERARAVRMSHMDGMYTRLMHALESMELGTFSLSGLLRCWDCRLTRPRRQRQSRDGLRS